MQIFSNITFLNPEYFWGFLIVPVLVYLFYLKEKKWINFINIIDAKKIFKNNNYKFYLKILLLWLILINFILILANPNKINISEKIKKNWIDIVIALDVSGSMEANDLKPNRMAVAKKVINDFIKKLETDRLWLVVFAWKPFTSIPLTFDYDILSQTIKRLDTKIIKNLNWTAVWDSILMSKTLFTNKCRGEPCIHPNREKIIILLTDWDANVWVDPILAWLSVKKENIKIYTIWIGSKKWWYITYDMWPFKQRQKIKPLNSTTLKQIAKDTNWKYFRADSNNTFEEIFKEIEKLEKNDIEVEIKKDYSEYYKIFLISLIILISLFWYLVIGNIEIKNKK